MTTFPPWAAADSGGVFDLTFASKFFVVVTGDFDVDLDEVEEGTADTFLVAGDRGGGTTALFDGVAVETAGTGVRIAVVKGISSWYFRRNIESNTLRQSQKP